MRMKKRFLSMLVLLLMAATGAWAQEPATYNGEKKVKSVKAVKKAVAPTYTLLSAATTSDYGKVVCAAGHLHDAKTAVPDGCTVELINR